METNSEHDYDITSLHRVGLYEPFSSKSHRDFFSELYDRIDNTLALGKIMSILEIRE